MRECEPRNFLQACLLLLLQERPDHGYELTERLKSVSDADNDSSGVYRALRGLEQRGMVCSSWSTSSAGPARRTYQITPTGAAALGRHARALKATRDILDGFLVRHERTSGSAEWAPRVEPAPGGDRFGAGPPAAADPTVLPAAHAPGNGFRPHEQR
jgi:PadR family transcriptional regulator, regulatory protein PadR